MLYNINKFQEDFLEYDFDIKLIEEDNTLLNSNKHYIDYKNDYLDSTKENYNKLNDILKKFKLLHNFYSKSSDNKYTYHFIDNSVKMEYNNKIKQIHIDQRNLFTNFIDHIDFLNMTKYILPDNKNQTIDKSRMTRLVDK